MRDSVSGLVQKEVLVKVGRHSKIVGDGRFVAYVEGKVRGRNIVTQFGKTPQKAIDRIKEEIARVGFRGEIKYKDVGDIS